MNINPRFQSVCPPLHPDEYAMLREQIRTDGLREPIITWQDQIVDGHNRFAICSELGITPRSVEREFSSESDVVLWIIGNQLGRRNLEPIRKVPLLAARKAILEDRARSRMEAGTPSLDLDKGRTDETLGKEIGVGKDTYRAMERTVQNGIKGLVDAVADGLIGAQPAAKISALPTDKQAEALANHIASDGRKKPHLTQVDGEVEWYTPLDWIERARFAMGSIELDPASCDKANEVVGAYRYLTKEDDALVGEWEAKTAWMNPPFKIGAQFAAKMIAEFQAGRIGSAVIYTNNSTDTGWWQDLACESAMVAFPTERIQCWCPNKDASTPLQGQSFFLLTHDEDVVARFKDAMEAKCLLFKRL